MMIWDRSSCEIVMMATRIVTVLASLIAVIGTGVDALGTERAADCLPADPGFWGKDVSGPLCGVYAACTAAELIGINADPRDFIAVRYVGGCAGSTAQEVADVIRATGARGSIVTRLSAYDLRHIDSPLIANVRASPATDRFDHWVVVTPSDNGTVIYDGAQAPYEVPTAIFLGSWNGMGICVTRDSNPLPSIWLGRSSLLLAVTVGGIVLLRTRAVGKFVNGASTFAKCGALLTASIVMSLAGNIVFGDLANHREGVAVATGSRETGKYRIGTLVDVRKAATDPCKLLVDARMQQDYQFGTIIGAVNMPVTASIWAIRKYVERLDRKTPIVIFCQSAKCEFDDAVAGQLVALGFTDVTVCDEGYAEYKQAETVATGQ